MFVFCPQCGHIFKKGKETHCPACNYQITAVPDKYLSANGNFFISQQARQAFLEEIAANPRYNKAFAANREHLLSSKQQQHKDSVSQKVLNYQAHVPTRKCPVCGSSNLTTISNLGKIAKISLIGIWGAGDLGKKWRCETCGHKF